MRNLFPLALLLVVGGAHQHGEAHRRGPFLQMFANHKDAAPNDNGDAGEPLFLTPLIRAKKLDEARRLSRVGGEAGRLAESYSGFLAVNSQICDSQLFFWFVPAKVNRKTAPVLLWLQGGPGGSSLFGLFVEHGPFGVDRRLRLVPRRKGAWTLTHSVIYVDQPVGTGFSFTEKDGCYATSETEVASDVYDLLEQFFLVFPEYRSNDFFVTGESYAGKYVPAVADFISERYARSGIELRGIAIGDGFVDPENMCDYGPMLNNIGLVDQVDADHFAAIATKQKQLIQQQKWDQAFQLFDELLNGDLTGSKSYFANVTGFDYYFNYLLPKPPRQFGYYPKWLGISENRRNIHVGNLTYHSGHRVESHLKEDIMKSARHRVEEFVKRSRVLVYNGQLDVIVGWPLTENFVKHLDWPGKDEFANAPRKQWRIRDELAGYSRSASNLTLVLVRNAGHMVPFDQPIWAFDLISRFTSGKDF